MQMNYFILLAMFVASDNGVHIATWIWIVAWVLTALRGLVIGVGSLKS